MQDQTSGNAALPFGILRRRNDATLNEPSLTFGYPTDGGRGQPQCPWVRPVAPASSILGTPRLSRIFIFAGLSSGTVIHCSKMEDLSCLKDIVRRLVGCSPSLKVPSSRDALDDCFPKAATLDLEPLMMTTRKISPHSGQSRLIQPATDAVKNNCRKDQGWGSVSPSLVASISSARLPTRAGRGCPQALVQARLPRRTDQSQHGCGRAPHTLVGQRIGQASGLASALIA